MRDMPFKKPLVLVADDSDEMREMVTNHLHQMRDPAFEVIEASDGEQAIELARRRRPDLVVLDVMMPEVSGWEVCKKIREDASLAHTGVVILTGIGENVNSLTSPLYGADAYIDKPFEFDDFDTVVRRALLARALMKNGVMGPAKAAKKSTKKSGPGVKKAAPKKTAKPATKATPKKSSKPTKKASAKKSPAKPKAHAKKSPPKKTHAKKTAPKKTPKTKPRAKKTAKKSGKKR